ncbi:4-hydroxythreonine-4-phosphate dehydrogenase PdxA [Hydrogenophaga pseudoflava]|uniref:4-hydroxythreonine-4-phosphate dehydrogenase PdxA n=1 Tax=Hydrogenophaga pseudoflava TaxID=47421 RepID=UPI0027E3FCC8|nr:4-hydroxythreonine-4-phosphate dehydrogenase PdxA [Hydrogenophaga pseudoflava]MDQ7743442.1 4-hydroxythreonine-4-phosphate dehydrogenase PdxA [Hydrogenophaga pseudoflava]
MDSSAVKNTPLSRPLVVTMGDPAGIGPEIVVRALLERPDLREQVVVAGDVATLRRAVEVVQPLSVPGRLEVVEIDGPEQWAQASRRGFGLVQTCVPFALVPWGRISAQAGRAAADSIAAAARWVLDGRARAMVTAPVHKESLAAAGLPHPGHTEFLQTLAAEHEGVPVSRMPVRMMLSAPGLATVLVSIHVSLRQALEAVTLERVLDTIRITASHYSRCGMPGARIAVAGLNPHAGEGGLFGQEEIDILRPAVERAQAEGLNVSGPHAPDTVFMRARQGEFDVVVAMYHDQGLIPVKLLGLEHGVNTTLGLPMVRTSPDHGTAFDLAGTGRASAASLLAAVDAAIEMSRR